MKKEEIVNRLVEVYSKIKGFEGKTHKADLISEILNNEIREVEERPDDYTIFYIGDLKQTRDKQLFSFEVNKLKSEIDSKFNSLIRNFLSDVTRELSRKDHEWRKLLKQ